MTARQRISVILPVRDGERLIGDAIESILAQRRQPEEIIIVDDGSTDGTRGVVESFGLAGLRYIEQANRGPAGARNSGLALASGSLVAFLDADDTWRPGKLTTQAALLGAHPEAGVVLGRTEGVALEDVAAAPRAFEAFWQSRHFLQLGAALFRRELFETVGPFDEELEFGEDLDWFMRAQEAGVQVERHEETVLRYRRHAGNLTNDTRRRDRDFLRTLKRSIDRRRAAAAPRRTYPQDA